MDRRGFLTSAALGFGAAIATPLTPIASAHDRDDRERAKGIKARALPAVPGLNTSITSFSGTGLVGVGASYTALGETFTEQPMIWRSTPTGYAASRLEVPGSGSESHDDDEPRPAVSVGAVNDAGIVLGIRAGVPVTWGTDGAIRELPLGGASRANPVALSSTGAVAGNASVGGKAVACMWVNGRLTQLPSDGATDSSVTSVNANGLVCGQLLKNRTWLPVIWNGTRLTYLPLGGLYSSAQATSIGEDGSVVGQATLRSTGKPQSVRWAMGRRGPSNPVRIGPKAVSSRALGVGREGRTVGTFVGADGIRRTFVAREDHWVELLPVAGLATPRTITSRGTVLGSSRSGGLAVPVMWKVSELD